MVKVAILAYNEHHDYENSYSSFLAKTDFVEVTEEEYNCLYDWTLSKNYGERQYKLLRMEDVATILPDAKALAKELLEKRKVEDEKRRLKQEKAKIAGEVKAKRLAEKKKEEEKRLFEELKKKYD